MAHVRRNLRLRDAIEDEATMAQVPLFGRFLTMVFTDFEKSKLAIASPFFSRSSDDSVHDGKPDGFPS